MNITIENYEAYLLDYQEGNLSPEGAAELKAFVAAQGLDWDELTSPLPYLAVPQIAYEGKLKLRSLSVSKGRSDNKHVVPLYVKITSVAAAAGLLLTVSLWPEKSMPKVEPLAELKPILPGRLIATSETTTLPPRTIHFVQPQVVKKEKPTVPEIVPKRTEMPLLAQLEPQKVSSLPTSTTFDEPDFDLVAYRMNTDLALAQIREYAFDEREDEWHELSFIGKSIFRLTNGKHSSLASLIGAGVRKAKQNLTEAATDMALAAYHRAEESFEERRERWEEKREE